MELLELSSLESLELSRLNMACGEVLVSKLPRLHGRGAGGVGIFPQAKDLVERLLMTGIVALALEKQILPDSGPLSRPGFLLLDPLQIVRSGR